MRWQGDQPRSHDVDRSNERWWKSSKLLSPSTFHNRVMSEVSNFDTPLRTTFKIRLNGKTVSIGTVGQVYRLITNLSSVEWMEFKSLHEDAVSCLQSAAGNAMLTVQATNALRALFVRAKLLRAASRHYRASHRPFFLHYSGNQWTDVALWRTGGAEVRTRVVAGGAARVRARQLHAIDACTVAGCQFDP